MIFDLFHRVRIEVVIWRTACWSTVGWIVSLPVALIVGPSEPLGSVVPFFALFAGGTLGFWTSFAHEKLRPDVLADDEINRIT